MKFEILYIGFREEGNTDRIALLLENDVAIEIVEEDDEDRPEVANVGEIGAFHPTKLMRINFYGPGDIYDPMSEEPSGTWYADRQTWDEGHAPEGWDPDYLRLVTAGRQKLNTLRSLNHTQEYLPDPLPMDHATEEQEETEQDEDAPDATGHNPLDTDW